MTYLCIYLYAKHICMDTHGIYMYMLLQGVEKTMVKEPLRFLFTLPSLLFIDIAQTFIHTK